MISGLGRREYVKADNHSSRSSRLGRLDAQKYCLGRTRREQEEKQKGREGSHGSPNIDSDAIESGDFAATLLPNQGVGPTGWPRLTDFAIQPVFQLMV
jgi:hypothetical protein